MTEGHLLGFFAASVLLGLSPGPDNLFVLMQSAQHGVRSGWAVVLGLCTGLLLHTAAVALGLAALLLASPWALRLLTWLGAAYLLWLAYKSWRAAPPVVVQDQTPLLPTPLKTLYLRGIVMNGSNPKVLIFFLAFLPQFVNPQLGHVPLQILVLGAVFMLATLLVFGGIAWLAGSWGQRLMASELAVQGINRLAAVVFAGLAIKLLI